MSGLHADFETQGLVDLSEVGLDAYAEHERTVPLCMGWAVDEEPIDLWWPGQPLPWAIIEHVTGGGLFYAHNAQFELTIWNRIMAKRYGWPKLDPSQVRCTMAMAYAMALPGKLEEMAPALGIEQRKDSEGHRVMQLLCKPLKIYKPGERLINRKAYKTRYEELPDGRIAEWVDDPAKTERLGIYCKQDVNVEREATKRLVPLSEREQKLWVIDQRINNRGVHIDVPAVKGALKVVETEKARLDAEMSRVTGGMVTACTNVNVLTDFLRFMGVETGGVAKADVVEMLADDTLPDAARQALLLRQEAGKASLAKLDKMLSLLGPGGRIRFTLAYHAATTGRWGGRGIQVQNFPRPAKWLSDPDVQHEILCRLAEGEDCTQFLDMMYGPPMDVLVNCLRGFLVPGDGCHFVADDFSNIEGRVIAWLAGEEWKLQAFREADAGTGPGIYELTYAKSFGIPVDEVTKDQRQVGKVEELALGFQGGVGAFQAMAKVYGVKLPDKEANRIKELWREAHPKIKQLWRDLEEAAIRAVLNPGAICKAGAEGRQIAYRVAGSFLWCRLPSGRVICYPYPKIQKVMTSWGEDKDQLTFMTVPGDRPQDKARILYDETNRSRWARMSTYGGSLAENVTQAVARDLLAEAIVRVEERGWPVVMHAHDEIVVEVPADAPDNTLHEIEQEMGRLPDWAAGLPVESKGWRGVRYQKG